MVPWETQPAYDYCGIDGLQEDFRLSKQPRKECNVKLEACTHSDGLLPCARVERGIKMADMAANVSLLVWVHARVPSHHIMDSK